MKKVIFILLMFIGMSNASAAYCDYIARGNEKKIAANVTFAYDYTINTEVIFTVTVNNLFENLQLKDPNGKIYTGKEEIIITGFKSGQTLKFEIISPNDECGDELLYTKYIILPNYNQYYNDPVCKNTDFSLCQKWVKNNYSYDEFVKLVKEYKNGSTNRNDKTNNDSSYRNIITFFIKYWYIYTLLIMLLIYIIYKIREEKKIGF